MSKQILSSFIKMRPRYYNALSEEWQPQSYAKNAVDIFITEDGQEKILTAFQEIEDRETELKEQISDAFADIAVGFPSSESWENIVYSIENIKSVMQTTFLFSFSEKAQTFTAPITGIYKIECYGSKGGDYTVGSTTYSGGYGGKVTAYIKLQNKDKVKIITGNSEGYKDGGKGAVSKGGGSTSVYINDVLCLVAGGGGGAGYRLAGGHGGANGTFQETSQGEDSNVSYSCGGGGGYLGGKAGYAIYHTHTGNSSTYGGCYTRSTYCGGSITSRTETHGCGGSYQPSYTFQWCRDCNHNENYCVTYPNGCVGGKTHNMSTRYGSKCNKCGRSDESWSGYPSGSCDSTSTSTVYYCSSCGQGYSGGGTCNRFTGYALNCGKSDSTPESSSSSYGGSNYYNKDLCETAVSTSGANTEDGKVRITLQ